MTMSTSCFPDAISLVGIVPALFCLIIVIYISVISIKQLRSHSMHTHIKVTYFITCALSIIAFTAFLMSTVVCPGTFRDILFTVGNLGYIGVGECVLAMLLLRLYFTFKDSIFEISEYQKWICIISYSMFLSIATTTLIIAIFVSPAPGIDAVRFIGTILTMIIYFGLSIYGMILFAQKMYQLVKMRQSSIYNQSSDDENEIEFNEQQKQLLYTTTKYLTLLTLSMVLTWINLSGALISYAISPNDYTASLILYIFGVLVTSIDFVIIIICLYLQYPFSKKYYDKYCKCFANCCTWIMMKKLTRSYQMRAKDDEIHLSNISGTTQQNEQPKIIQDQKIAVQSNDEEESTEVKPTVDRYESHAL